MDDPLKKAALPGFRYTCRRDITLQTKNKIKSVGFYVPRGTTTILPSTALMLGVPAQLLGCKTIVLATHPREDGTISPEVIYAAKKCGVT